MVIKSSDIPRTLSVKSLLSVSQFMALTGIKTHAGAVHYFTAGPGYERKTRLDICYPFSTFGLVDEADGSPGRYYIIFNAKLKNVLHDKGGDELVEQAEKHFRYINWPKVKDEARI